MSAMSCCSIAGHELASGGQTPGSACAAGARINAANTAATVRMMDFTLVLLEIDVALKSNTNVEYQSGPSPWSAQRETVITSVEGACVLQADKLN
jgi:hypothetical protein